VLDTLVVVDAIETYENMISYIIYVDSCEEAYYKLSLHRLDLIIINKKGWIVIKVEISFPRKINISV